MNDYRILVVDDESRMRKLVKDFLVRSNYEVLEAEDGEKALDIFFADMDGRYAKRSGHILKYRSSC